MKNVNKLLIEEIKGLIMEALMKNDLAFSELLEKTNLRDHGQLNYHLKLMQTEGLVEKNGEKYTRTPLGERLGVYINQFQSKEMYPLSVVCAIIRNEKKEILMIQRAKNPQKGRWGFPGGKIAMGETISQAAERETLEETGLKLKTKKVSGFFPSIVYSNGNLCFHANLIVVHMESVKSGVEIKRDPNEHDDVKFVSLKEIPNYPLIANNEFIIPHLDKDDFCFQELITKE